MNAGYSPLPASAASRRDSPAVAENGREGATPRRVIGFSKSGMRVALHERGEQIVLRGRADPLLLYLAIGGALGLGLLASILRSPVQGVVSSFIYSALFSPLLLFLIYSTLRLRSHCVINRAQGKIYVTERSYAGVEQFSLPLDSLVGILVTARSQLPIVGGPETYSLYLETEHLLYLVLAGYDEGSVLRLAERLGEALRLPVRLRGFDQPGESIRLPGRLLATTAVLYLVPPLVAIVAIYLAFRDAPLPERLMITSVGAIVLSQLGAILAYGYYRSREPREG